MPEKKLLLLKISTTTKHKEKGGGSWSVEREGMGGEGGVSAMPR